MPITQQVKLMPLQMGELQFGAGFRIAFAIYNPHAQSCGKSTNEPFFLRRVERMSSSNASIFEEEEKQRIILSRNMSRVQKSKLI